MLAGRRGVRVEDGVFGAGVRIQWEEERRGQARTDAGGAGPRLIGT